MTPDTRLPPGERDRRNRSIILSFALICTIVALLVSGLPDVLVPPALDQLFALAGLGAGLAALLRSEHLLAPHLTYWDKSAALIGLSTAAGLYTDPALVEQTMQQVLQADGGSVSAGRGGLSGGLSVPDPRTETDNL